MKDCKVWQRIGDPDDYTPYDSLDEAVEELHYMLHVTTEDPWEPGDGPCPTGGHEIERYSVGGSGISIPIAGLDVSLYWGDDDAQKVAALSDSELEYVRTLLK